MRHRLTEIVIGGGIFMLLIAFGDFRGEPQMHGEMVFDTCSEYMVLSVIENEIAVLATQQEMYTDEGNGGRKVTGLPHYVTEYPNLYAPDKEEVDSPEEQHPAQGKTAYLTFDDGPSENTIRVLDILKQEGIHATFFLIGEEITPEREEIVKRIVEEGHTIGLHTYCHDYQKMYRSVEAFLEDYENVCERICEVTGQVPGIFRFPGGSANYYARGIIGEIKTEMERRGFCYYDWNVSAEDSVGTPTRYSIRANIFKDVFRYDRPVILMHDSMSNGLTASMLTDIITEIRDAGYAFDTLDHREICHFGT